MRNIKLTIEYDGTDFCGWQIQPNQRTVQGVMEQTISRLMSEEIRITGAGRTDSGVHALGQVANFKTGSQMGTDEIFRALNALLPDDIAVSRVDEVGEEFNARYDAISRTYVYSILNRRYRSPLASRSSWFFPGEFDVDLANDALRQLLGRQDFSSFQKTGSSRKNPVCTITRCFCRREGDFIRIVVEADSFLRGMVRAIVGTLVRIMGVPDGAKAMRDIIERRDRSAAGASVPPQGLCLLKVKYEEDTVAAISAGVEEDIQCV